MAHRKSVNRKSTGKERMTFSEDMKWDAMYKRLCCEMLNMNPYQAEMHFRTAPDFDRNYSPYWYITEEINCEFIKRKG